MQGDRERSRVMRNINTVNRERERERRDLSCSPCRHTCIHVIVTMKACILHHFKCKVPVISLAVKFIIYPRT